MTLFFTFADAVNFCSLPQTAWHILRGKLRKGKYKCYFLQSPLHIPFTVISDWLEQYFLLFVHLLGEHDFHSISARWRYESKWAL